MAPRREPLELPAQPNCGPWRGGSSRRLTAFDDVGELAIPPGNRLERLGGDRKGQYSMRINDQYRICFHWETGYAHSVEITDYH